MQNPITVIEAHQKRVDKMNEELELPSNGTSLDLLRIVYRSTSLPLPVRIRAAAMALPHEHPRLAVVAQVTDQGLAELLDRRLKKLAAMENGKMIEQAPQSQPSIDARLTPRIADRRFRRL